MDGEIIREITKNDNLEMFKYYTKDLSNINDIGFKTYLDIASKNKSNKIVHYFLTHIEQSKPITLTSNPIRPSVREDFMNSANREDELTHKLVEIIKANKGKDSVEMTKATQAMIQSSSLHSIRCKIFRNTMYYFPDLDNKEYQLKQAEIIFKHGCQISETTYNKLMKDIDFLKLFNKHNVYPNMKTMRILIKEGMYEHLKILHEYWSNTSGSTVYDITKLIIDNEKLEKLNEYVKELAKTDGHGEKIKEINEQIRNLKNNNEHVKKLKMFYQLDSNNKCYYANRITDRYNLPYVTTTNQLKCIEYVNSHIKYVA